MCDSIRSALLKPSLYNISEVPVPRALIGLWAANGYAFQLTHDLDEEAGVESLVCWWFEKGQVEHPGLSGDISDYLIAKLHQVDLDTWNEGEPLAPSLLMLAVYHSRKGLRDTYDLSITKDLYEFWKWWFVFGSSECGLPLKGLPQVAEGTSRKLSINDQLIPNELLSIYAAFGKILNIEADLCTRNGIGHLVYWWLINGRKIFAEIDFSLSSKIYKNLSRVIVETSVCPMTLLMEIVYSNRTDLKGVFDLSKLSGRDAFCNWWNVHGMRELQLDIFEGSYELSRKSMNREEAVSDSFRVSSYPIFTALLGFLESNNYPFLLNNDLEKNSEIEYLVRWWIESGQFENPTVSNEVTKLLVDKFHQVNIDSLAVQTPLPPSLLMRSIYNSREGLRKAYDLTCTYGLNEFWRWWFSFGSQEYNLPSRGLPSIRDNNKIKIRIDTAELPIDLLVIYFAFGNVLGLKFDLKSREGVSQLVYWWFVSGRKTFADLNIKLSKSLYRALSNSPPQGDENTITQLMQIVYLNRSDLTGAFDIHMSKGRAAFLNWWATHGVEEYQLYLYDKLLSKNQIKVHTEVPSVSQCNCLANFKINIIGYPSGQFGIGEDARLLYSAAVGCGLDVELWQSKRKIPATSLANETYNSVTDLSPGGINIYCMPPFDTMALLHDLGVSAFDAKYKIGFWQWELSTFPIEAESVFELVDEVWTISEFVATSLKSATNKPVKVIPMPFEHITPAINDRNYFGIPRKSFVYYFAFDGASFISRKNPMGVIDAFQRAFPDKNDDSVFLVIKTMGIKNDSLWRECLRRSGADARISILDEVYTREKLCSLMNSIDCFVSLHRAEGFGRLIAEAIISGKRVIASEYSGNMDFLNKDNAYLVGGTVSQLLPGDYHFYKGSQWFDPDLDSAAKCFIDAYRNREKFSRERQAAASRAFNEIYNLQSTGESIKKNLAGLSENISREY